MFSNLFFGKKLLLTLFIIFLICWIIIFIWFLIDENKYKDNLDLCNFARPFYENNNKKIFYSNAITDSLYFTTTAFGTFGYGDIYPKTTIAKLYISLMHFIIIIFSMNLYENFFIENKTIKDLSLDITKLTSTMSKSNNKNSNYLQLI